MVYLISAFWAALEYIHFYLFWGAFLPSKCSRKKEIAIFAAAWVFSLVYLNLELSSPQRYAVTFLLLALMTTLLHKGTWYQRAVVITFGYILASVIDAVMGYGVSAVLGLSLEQFTMHKWMYVITATVGKLLAIFLSWLIRHYRVFRDFGAIQRKWLLLTILFPLTSLAMLVAVFDGSKDSSDFTPSVLFFSGMLIVANIAIIYLIKMMEKSTIAEQETALLKQQMEIQTDSILALEKSYRTQRQATHDFRNQLQTIYDLLTKKQYGLAIDYVQELQGIQTTRILIVNSRHAIVDAIINQKYQTAQTYAIELQIQVNDLSGIRLQTNHLVVLLSNLLDNAIEGCARRNGDRIIQCKILHTDSLYISIRNTSDPVVIVDNQAPTSKEPREDHGHGMQRIQKILEQLNAEFAFTYENGWFEFVAEIPYC